MWKKETKTKTVKKLIVVLAALAVLFILGLSFAGVFRVRQVTVTGNAYYTKEEVVDLLLDEGSLQNTLLVYLRYKYQEHPEIPFIDDFEVTMDSWQSLKIRVYEKNMVGYVRYLGQDVYFDKDGIVVESSTETFEKVPEIIGLKFNSIVLDSKLEVGDDEVFRHILDLTQSFDKYNLDVSKVYFDSSDNVILYIDEVKVYLGKSDDYTDKLFELKQMETKFAGLKGSLYMQDYTKDSSSIIFKKDEYN